MPPKRRHISLDSLEDNLAINTCQINTGNLSFNTSSSTQQTPPLTCSARSATPTNDDRLLAENATLSSPYSIVETTPEKCQRGRLGPSLKRNTLKKQKCQSRQALPAPNFVPDDNADQVQVDEEINDLGEIEGGLQEMGEVEHEYVGEQPLMDDTDEMGVSGRSGREQEKRVRAEERRAKEREEKAVAEAAQARQLWTAMTKKVPDGGYGFTSLNHFVNTIFTTKDQQISATMGRYANDHGRELINLVAQRARPQVVRDATMDLLIPILRNEGNTLQ
ncbi:hypothetical protein OF83DRAFT_1179483 [Amylostereum chailletii]|nr:hypothetical protein OF83DRAFT_1179483 [Amylostereum chailletii]